jgi:uncharacterized protein (DUF305 family)
VSNGTSVNFGGAIVITQGSASPGIPTMDSAFAACHSTAGNAVLGPHPLVQGQVRRSRHALVGPRMSRLSVRTAAVAPLLMILAVSQAGCGTADRAAPPKAATDGAYLQLMRQHAQIALETVRIALPMAKAPAVRRLARSIQRVARQEQRRIDALAPHVPKAPDHSAELDLTPAERGTDLKPSMLRRARPFAPAFIAVSVRQTQGALRLAQLEIEHGTDIRVKKLATTLAVARTRLLQRLTRFQASP